MVVLVSFPDPHDIKTIVDHNVHSIKVSVVVMLDYRYNISTIGCGLSFLGSGNRIFSNPENCRSAFAMKKILFTCL